MLEGFCRELLGASRWGLGPIHSLRSFDTGVLDDSRGVEVVFKRAGSGIKLVLSTE